VSRPLRIFHAPFARRVRRRTPEIFQRKFEWLFKYRNESNLNEPKPAHGGEVSSITVMPMESGVSAFGEYLVTVPVVAALTNSARASRRRRQPQRAR
jgi:hypothetical protein